MMMQWENLLVSQTWPICNRLFDYSELKKNSLTGLETVPMQMAVHLETVILECLSKQIMQLASTSRQPKLIPPIVVQCLRSRKIWAQS